MNQQLLIQSGCQQWIRQPVAIGPCQQFVVCSSLAIYIHGSQDYRLLRILAQYNQHLNAICWNPVDSNLLACATSQQIIKVYHVENEGVVYSAQAPMPDAIKKLCWSTHDENVLLAAAGNVIGSWAYKTGNWQSLHSFKAAVTCMQQSASETRLLAVGCADCSLQLYDLLLHKVVSTVCLEAGVVPCDVLFDPLSNQYLLLLCRNGSTMLYQASEDDHALNQVLALAKQPAAERSAAFVPSQPGNFVCISDKTGVLQLWNVSQQQPLKNMKTGKGPAQSVQFLPGSTKALLSFQDGTVMVYDIIAQEPLWSTQPGHTETIFDCNLHPTNPRLLATCSYDSTVRVWDIGSGNCVKTFGLAGGLAGQGQSLALYSVTWSQDGSHLAASGADGAVYLYDYAKGTAVRKWQLHSKASLKVAWHPVDPTLLASSSMDGSVVAFKTDGAKIKVLRHSGCSSGLAWHPIASHQLATTSEAGHLYVWDLNRPVDSCLLQTLSGHSKRSFSVAWSPLLPNLLLSGSDDATARVWEVTTGTCTALLLGHALEVRALCWHPEVPWLVFTGSWDSTIRAWDIRSNACIHVNTHHHSDVYGLSIHKAYPWVMVSASRDTTLRLWDIKGLAAGLLSRCILDVALPRGQAEQYMTHSQPLLCGVTSQQLADCCTRHVHAKANAASNSLTSTSTGSLMSTWSPAARVEVFQKLSAFLSAPGPAHTLWQLAAAVVAHLTSINCITRTDSIGHVEAPCRSTVPLAAAQQHAGSMSLMRSCSNVASGALKPLPEPESCGFQHVTAAQAALVSAANQLELSARARGTGKVTMGAAKTEVVLIQAALMHLQAGKIEHCCDILMEAGDWDKALMIAPAVSLQYWAKLLQKRADAAVQAGANMRELLPLLLAAGQTQVLTERLLAQKHYDLAASVAAVQACGGYQQLSDAAAPEASVLTVAAAAPTSPASPSRALLLGVQVLPGALSPLSSPPQVPVGNQVPQLLSPHEASSLSMRRNSLPPLRNAGSISTSAVNATSSSGAAAVTTAGGSNASHQSASCSAALTTTVTAAEGLNRSGSFGRPGSPVSVLGSRLASSSPVGDGAAAAAQHSAGSSSMLEGSLQISGSFARVRSCSGALGPAAGSPIMDAASLDQLAAVRQAQAMSYRQQGQPVLAACAALTVNDIQGAITALHLGHEPEQAAMLALALSQLATVDSSLLDRVYAALATRCESAGDWEAAAMATQHFSKEVPHYLQLLVVRSEHNAAQYSLSSATAAEGYGTPADPPQQQTVQGLRQRLHLRDAAYYATVATTASDSLDCVRYLLLAGDHARAATLASTHLRCLVERLQAVILQPAAGGADLPSTYRPGQQPGVLDQLPQVQQLYLWQACLDSLDPSRLEPRCWQVLFAYNLLAGALKAFSYGYTKVGNFLMSSLRRWIEQHQVEFPMCRASLLVLESEVLQHTSPESACSLLIAAADAPETPADIAAAARQKLQAFPKPASAAASSSVEASYVVPTGSSWPCRSAPGSGRSAVSGKLVRGPWMLLDDGSSVVTFGEGVMLAHVMRSGPCGSGKVLQLL